MARFNEILVGRFNRALQKLTAIKGSPPAPVLGSEINAVFPLFFGSENRYLEGWNKITAVLPAGGVAGQTGAVRIRNPAGSNVIAVVEMLTLQSTAAETIAIAVGLGNSSDLTTPLPATRIQPLDFRWKMGTNLSLSTSNNFAIGGFTANFPSLGGTANVGFQVLIDELHEIPLAPDTMITLASQTAAATLTIGVMWRERFLEDSERS